MVMVTDDIDSIREGRLLQIPCVKRRSFSTNVVLTWVALAARLSLSVQLLLCALLVTLQQFRITPELFRFPSKWTVGQRDICFKSVVPTDLVFMMARVEESFVWLISDLKERPGILKRTFIRIISVRENPWNEDNFFFMPSEIEEF